LLILVFLIIISLELPIALINGPLDILSFILEFSIVNFLWSSPESKKINDESFPSPLRFIFSISILLINISWYINLKIAFEFEFIFLNFTLSIIYPDSPSIKPLIILYSPYIYYIIFVI